MTQQPSHALPLVRRGFPHLPEESLGRLQQLAGLVREWNARLNLISRKDIGNLEERHLLHSLAVAKVWQPDAGARVADLGTGGGFPGLPLAVLFPDCRFALVESIGKKARAVAQIAAELALCNVDVLHDRAENVSARFDYVLGRAVAVLPRFLDWALPLVEPGAAGTPANGAFYFKGTRYREELADDPRQPTRIWELSELFEGEFFREKFLLYFRC